MKSIFSPTRYCPCDWRSMQNLLGHLQGGSSEMCFTWNTGNSKAKETLQKRWQNVINLRRKEWFLTASSRSLPVLFLLELLLLNGEMDGETGGDWELDAGGTGESGGSGNFSSSCSISFSSFISPGGSTLYLTYNWSINYCNTRCIVESTLGALML